MPGPEKNEIKRIRDPKMELGRMFGRQEAFLEASTAVLLITGEIIESITDFDQSIKVIQKVTQLASELAQKK